MTDINRISSRGLVAKASIKTNASIAKVWEALINPQKIKKYMFGTTTWSLHKLGKFYLECCEDKEH